ncbi:MAG: helix-turn-helix transcriptional regulator [Acidimicrobiia bacterium]|nr:helix-turn-helix transcriptional regulator [Acidimicrobiia bacterium]
MATNDTIKLIATTLRDERRRRNLTQEQFADLLGVTRAYLGELESGKGTTHLIRLVRALNAVGVDLVPVRRHDSNQP